MKGEPHRALACAGVLFCLMLPAVFAVGGPIGRASAEANASWTIGLYVDADNDFDTYWEGLSLLYLKSIPACTDVNVVAFVVMVAQPVLAHFGYGEFEPSPQWVIIGSTVVTVVNLLLRLFATKKAVRFSR